MRKLVGAKMSSTLDSEIESSTANISPASHAIDPMRDRNILIIFE